MTVWLSENRASSPLPKYQFRLRYLIYLLTLVSIGLAFLRYMLDISPDHQFILVMSAYVALLIAYFAFRFPFLIRRVLHGRRAIKSRRSELIDFADQVRRRKEEEEMTDDG